MFDEGKISVSGKCNSRHTGNITRLGVLKFIVPAIYPFSSFLATLACALQYYSAKRYSTPLKKRWYLRIKSGNPANLYKQFFMCVIFYSLGYPTGGRGHPPAKIRNAPLFICVTLHSLPSPFFKILYAKNRIEKGAKRLWF